MFNSIKLAGITFANKFKLKQKPSSLLRLKN